MGEDKDIETHKLEEDDYNGCCTVDRSMLPAKVAFFFKGARLDLDSYFLMFFVSFGMTPGSASIVTGCMFIGLYERCCLLYIFVCFKAALPLFLY